jgi:hypothetical protein
MMDSPFLRFLGMGATRKPIHLKVDRFARQDDEATPE